MKNTGVFDKTEEPGQVQQADNKDEGMVEVPDLVGKTEEEAKALVEAVNLGKQMVGEEASDQEKGRISSQDIPAGTKVEAYTTLKYYISKGQEELTIPEYDETVTAYAYQKSLEDMGLTVNVQKEAVTEFGKWLEINITKQQSADVPAGQVISQSPEAEETADPDEPASLVVSSGDQPPEAEPAADSSGAQTSADTSAQQQAAANGEVWKCTQSLNTPQDYKGGALRLELIQEVNGESEATTVVDGETLTFPYKLDITGSPGVSEGTLSVSEMINGEYQQLGTYPLTFEKAE